MVGAQGGGEPLEEATRSSGDAFAIILLVPLYEKLSFGVYLVHLLGVEVMALLGFRSTASAGLGLRA